MLGKLIKHEFKAINRLMIPLHIGLLAVTVVGRFYVQFVMNRTHIDYTNTSLRMWEGLMDVMLISAYVIALIAVYIITWLYVSVLRPRKNLFTDEGYLMHTLPASTSEHIVSKLVVASVWRIADILLIGLSIFIMVVNKYIIQDFGEFWHELWFGFSYIFDVPAGLGMSAFLLIELISIVSNLLIFYACIAIGHSFNSHRILASIGVFVGYNIINNLISSIFTAIVGVGSFGSSSFYNVFFGIGYNNPYVNAARYFWLNMGFAAVFSLVMGAAAFVLANHFMSRRLNLE